MFGREALKKRYAARTPKRPPLPSQTRGYICPVCDLVLMDGVAYEACPSCHTGVDWVDLTRHVWACPDCDAVVQGESEPYCDACERVLLLVHDPAKVQTTEPGGRTIWDVFESDWMLGFLFVCSLAPLLIMATHPMLRVALLAMAGPIVVLPVLLAISFLGMFSSKLSEIRALLSEKTKVVHGLEHATIKLLEKDGFTVGGGVTLSEKRFLVTLGAEGKRAASRAIKRAFKTAVRRIRGGEEDLVYDPRCGTSALVGVSLFALLAVAAGVVGLFMTIPPIASALALALLAGVPVVAIRPLGLLAQRLFTVSSDFERASPVKVIRRGRDDDATVYEVVVAVQ